MISKDIKKDLSGMINSLGLMDLDLNKARFTWCNRRSGSNRIQVWLDRGLLSPDWLMEFSCHISSLSRIGSDHFPIILSISPLYRRKYFPFRFEKTWTLNVDLYNNITDW